MGRLTQRYIVVALYRDVLGLFDIVNTLQDGQAVADAGDAHRLQILVQQCDEGFSNNVIFCATS